MSHAEGYEDHILERRLEDKFCDALPETRPYMVQAASDGEVSHLPHSESAKNSLERCAAFQRPQHQDFESANKRD
jgi:hypothetical protein